MMFELSPSVTESGEESITLQLKFEGSATAGTDYEIVPVTLKPNKWSTVGTYNAASNDDRVAFFYTKADNLVEGSETVSITLEQPASGGGYSVHGGSQTRSSTITDSPAKVEIRATDSSATESAQGDTINNAVLRVTRQSGTGNLAEPLSVTLEAGANGTAEWGTDYRLSNTTVQIPAGSTFGQVLLEPIDDPDAEGIETAKVTIGGAGTTYVLASTTQATTRANIDDNVSVSSIRVFVHTAAENRINKVSGYHFAVTVEVKGEKVDQVEIRQDVRSSTEAWYPDGERMTLEQIIAQFPPETDPVGFYTGGQYKQDTGWDWGRLHDVAADRSTGVRRDEQRLDWISRTIAYGTGTATGSFPITVRTDYRISWRKVGTQEEHLGHEWGYSWTNTNLIWPPDHDPAPPPRYRWAIDKISNGKGIFEDVHGIDGLPY